MGQTSNKIIQKGLAFAGKQSGTDSVPTAETCFGILPRRLVGRGGASVVAAQCRQNPNGGSNAKACGPARHRHRHNTNSCCATCPIKKDSIDKRPKEQRRADLKASPCTCNASSAKIDDVHLGRIASFSEIARGEGQGERHIRLLAPLAFVSPRIIAAIIDGSAPADLTVTGVAKALPYSWAEQERSIRRLQ